MRFLHLADLHLGKKLGDYSLEDDQVHILKQIINYAQEYKVEAIVIAGDIYDKAQPQTSAVKLWDWFLAQLQQLELVVLVIAGNHDAPVRLAYGANLFKKLDIHVVGELSPEPKLISLTDQYGPVHFVLIPFFRLYELQRFVPEGQAALATYTQGLEFLLSKLNLPAQERKVFVSHQHYTHLARDQELLLSDSEENIIGGLEAIHPQPLVDFSYVALGHLHRPQDLGLDYMRYAGSPLVYSLSELGQTKSIPLVELTGSKKAKIELLPLEPLREVVEIKGQLKEILAQAQSLSTEEREIFCKIVLTDQERVHNPLGRLQVYYDYILQIEILREQLETEKFSAPLQEAIENLDLLTLFQEFYRQQTGRSLAEVELNLLKDLKHKYTQDQEGQERL